MTIHPFKSVLALLTLMLPLASTAATPEEEAKFVDAVKKAFDEKKPGDLSKLTCWDGVSEETRKKGEETYKGLIEEKEVTFTFTLVEADLKKRKVDGGTSLPNLKIIKQLDMRMIDQRDNKRTTLGIIGFAVGEKEGKLLFVREAPAK